MSGFCRDWYWRSHGAESKIYKQRQNTMCTVISSSFDLGYYYYLSKYRLCVCEDNVSQAEEL